MKLDHDLLLYLKEEGYTVLIAENNPERDWYEFTPRKWEIEALIEETMGTDFEQEILIIDEALKMNFEDLLNHTVNITI